MGWDLASTTPAAAEPIDVPREPARIRRTATSGPLPDALRGSLEAESGISMSGVQVHYRSAEPASVGALAFAESNRINLAPGQERHLAHEAWHVVQQRQGRVRANAVVAGRLANVDPRLEAEADRMGARLERGLAHADRIQRRTWEPSSEPSDAGSTVRSRIQRRTWEPSSGPFVPSGPSDVGTAVRSRIQRRTWEPPSEQSDAESTARSRIQRKTATAAVEPSGAPVVTGQPVVPEAGVIQGRWAGVGPELVAQMSADPIGALLAWSRQHAASLDVSVRLGANALEQIARDREWTGVRASMGGVLRQTLNDPGTEYGPHDLFPMVWRDALQFGFRWDELAGGDHPEDLVPGNPEIPITLENLDALVFAEIDPDDDGLAAIALRLMVMHPELQRFANTGPWAWVQWLQGQIERQKRERLQQFLEGLAGGEGQIGQFKHSSNTDSGPRSYNGANAFGYKDVVYLRDGQGSIDFGTKKSATTWSSPEVGGNVDLTTGIDQTKYPNQGELSSGSLAVIPGGARAQHFSIANRIIGNGYGRNSPPGETWHHLSARYWMIRVDTMAHSKHGHNGGNLLW